MLVKRLYAIADVTRVLVNKLEIKMFSLKVLYIEDIVDVSARKYV